LKTGGVGVPISAFKSYLEPQLLAALQKVFDEAWREINPLPGRAATARDAAERRTDLAQMIFLAHKSGIPPERIKDAVLGRQIPGPSKSASRRDLL
jgi:hypothetical protein